MESMNNNAEISQATSSPEPQQSAQPVQNNTVSAPVEKMVPQSKVDEIVRHANANVAEKVRREMAAQQQQSFQQASTPVNGAAIGGMPADIDNLVQQKVQQTLQNLAQQNAETQQKAYVQRVANDFYARLETAKQSDPDFKTIADNTPFMAFPNTVLTSMNFDNTADIMQQLAKDPANLAKIEDLAQRDLNCAQSGYSSNMAFQEMKKISDSIRANKLAATVKTANPPLNQIQPSPVGTDNGSVHNFSVKDFQKASFIKNRRK